MLYITSSPARRIPLSMTSWEEMQKTKEIRIYVQELFNNNMEFVHYSQYDHNQSCEKNLIQG